MYRSGERDSKSCWVSATLTLRAKKSNLINKDNMQEQTLLEAAKDILNDTSSIVEDFGKARYQNVKKTMALIEKMDVEEMENFLFVLSSFYEKIALGTKETDSISKSGKNNLLLMRKHILNAANVLFYRKNYK